MPPQSLRPPSSPPRGPCKLWGVGNTPALPPLLQGDMTPPSGESSPRPQAAWVTSRRGTAPTPDLLCKPSTVLCAVATTPGAELGLAGADAQAWSSAHPRRLSPPFPTPHPGSHTCIALLEAAPGSTWKQPAAAKAPPGAELGLGLLLPLHSLPALKTPSSNPQGLIK